MTELTDVPLPAPASGASSTTAGKRRWLTLAMKISIVTVVAVFIVITARRSWGQIEDYRWQLSWGWLSFAGLLYLAGLIPCGLFWHRTLLCLGQQPRLGETLRAYFIGHLGKYVPGKALVVVLRAGLIRSQRVDTGVAAVSVFYETLTMMATGAFLAAAILAGWFRAQWGFAAIAAGLSLAALLPTLPPVFRRLSRLTGVVRRNPDVAERMEQLGYATLTWGWLSMTVGWVLMGLSFWATLRGMGIDTTASGPLTAWSQLPLLTAAVSLAMVAGFLSLIPGGALVRETVLLGLMQPELGEGPALLAAVVLRLVWLAAELLLSGLLYWQPGLRKKAN